MVAAPDDVAQLLLAGGLVEKSKLLRPNLIEDNPAGRRFDRLRLGVSINRLLAVIRVLDPDAVVGSNASLGHGKFHFDGIDEEWKPAVALTSAAAPRVLRQVIAAESDVLRWRSNRLAA